MITYQDRQVWQRPWIWALIVGTASGAGVWWWLARAENAAAQAAQLDQTAKPAVAVASAPAADAKPIQSALIVPPQILSDGRPSDFTPEDWTALKNAMAKTPNPKAETERVVRYLRFQRGFEQWQTMKNSPDVAQRQELARRLLEQVPERLRQGETTMGEALMLATALLTDLEPNEELRRQRLEEAKTTLVKSAPKPDSAQVARDASMLAEYKRREAAIVADYQAKPAAQRDQAKLEEALEAARRSVYAGEGH